MNIASPLAMSFAQAALTSGVGRSTLYAEVAKGNLKIRKVGRRSLIAYDDLKNWLDSKAT